MSYYFGSSRTTTYNDQYRRHRNYRANAMIAQTVPTVQYVQPTVVYGVPQPAVIVQQPNVVIAQAAPINPPGMKSRYTRGNIQVPKPVNPPAEQPNHGHLQGAPSTNASAAQTPSYQNAQFQAPPAYNPASFSNAPPPSQAPHHYQQPPVHAVAHQNQNVNLQSMHAPCNNNNHMHHNHIAPSAPPAEQISMYPQIKKQ